MIDILLSTYNGAKYLSEQLDSLISQDYTDWRLLVRDDGSTDETLSVVRRYAERDERIHIMHDELGNIGVIRSFEELLRWSEAPYVMFCDQDDVWLESKVSKTLERVQSAEGKVQSAVLCFTDLCVVDEQLRTLYPSFWSLNRDPMPTAARWPWVAVANPMPGCTAMLNRRAVEAVLPFPASIPMHDWWIICRIARMGKVIYVPEATILYRQHGGNTWGVRQADAHYYLSVLHHMRAKWQEFRALEPFLREIGFGGAVRYGVYKCVYWGVRRML